MEWLRPRMARLGFYHMWDVEEGRWAVYTNGVYKISVNKLKIDKNMMAKHAVIANAMRLRSET